MPRVFDARPYSSATFLWKLFDNQCVLPHRLLANVTTDVTLIRKLICWSYVSTTKHQHIYRRKCLFTLNLFNMHIASTFPLLLVVSCFLCKAKTARNQSVKFCLKSSLLLQKHFCFVSDKQSRGVVSIQPPGEGALFVITPPAHCVLFPDKQLMIVLHKITTH